MMVKEIKIGPKKIKIPMDWDKKKVSDEYKIKRGESYSSKYYVKKGEGMRFFTLNSIKKGGGIKKDSIKYYNKNISDSKKIKPGELVIANTDLTQGAEIIGYPAKIPEYDDLNEMCFSHHLSKLKPINNNYNVDYLFYLFCSYSLHAAMKSFSAGTTVLNLDRKSVENMTLPFPPIKEQKKIAAILSAVDETIEKTDQVIEKIKELKKGLMQQLFTKGIGHDEFKDINTNGKNLKIPVDWDLRLIKEVAEINKNNISTDTPKNYEIEYIDISSINDIGKIEETNIYKYKDAPSRAKRLVDLNDVIVSTVRPYLKSFSVIKRQEENLVCSTGFAVLSPKTNIISGYIYYFVWSNHFVNYMKRLMRGTSYPAVNINDVANTYLPLPPLEEQKKIASILSTVDENIQKEEEYKTKLERLKKGLMQKLLTGEIRVNIED